MKKIELKNCPFCNGESRFIQARKEGQVNLPAEIRCDTCGLAYVDGGKQKGRLVEWYNKRKISVLKITDKGGREFFANQPAKIEGSTIEVVEMSGTEYQAIPSTTDAAKFFKK